jgi:hypothetical protein
MIFLRCNVCGSFRTENGEDVALRVSVLEEEITRLRKALEWYAKGGRAVFSEGYSARPVEHWNFLVTKIARDALEGME